MKKHLILSEVSNHLPASEAGQAAEERLQVPWFFGKESHLAKQAEVSE